MSSTANLNQSSNVGVEFYEDYSGPAESMWEGYTIYKPLNKGDIEDFIPMCLPDLTHTKDEGCGVSHEIALDQDANIGTDEAEAEDAFDPDMFLNKGEDVCASFSPADDVMMFSPADSGYGSECPSPPYTSANLAGATHFSKRSREPSEDSMLSVNEESKVLVCDKTHIRPGATNSPNKKPSNANLRVGVTNSFKRPREASDEDLLSVKMGKVLVSDDTRPGATNHITIKQINRGEEKMTPNKDAARDPPQDTTGATNYRSSKWIELTTDSFQEKLFKLRAKTHCSVCVDVQIVESGIVKAKGIQRLSQVTVAFLETHFENNCTVYLKKKPLKNLILDVFKDDKASFKRSTAECGHVLRGVALHLIDLDIQSRGLDRKKANNKFTEFQRLDRNAGDKEAQKHADKHNINIDKYSYSELEDKMGISLMVFDKLGYLDYCSPQLQRMNCVFYEHDEKVYMVKEKSLKAFGNVFNKGKKQ